MTQKQSEQIRYAHTKIKYKLKDKTGLQLEKYIEYLCDNTDVLTLAYLYEKNCDILPIKHQEKIEEKLQRFMFQSTLQTNENQDQKVVKKVGEILYRMNEQNNNF